MVKIEKIGFYKNGDEVYNLYDICCDCGIRTRNYDFEIKGFMRNKVYCNCGKDMNVSI